MIRQNPIGLSRDELIEKMRLKGNKSGERSVSNALAALISFHTLDHKDGKYYLSSDRKTVLIIDMNPKTSRRIADYVDEAGMDYVVAESFEHAIEEVARRRFTGIFVDLHADSSAMDKAGLSFARHLADGQGPNKDTPIVVLVETNQPHDLDEIFEAPIQARVRKEKAGVPKQGIEEALRAMVG